MGEVEGHWVMHGNPTAFRRRPQLRSDYLHALWLDMLALAGLTVMVALLAGHLLHTDRVPFEDAAMLMRYAENLASGHGIVWNLGAAPVDGATDFLFLLLLALVTKIGVTVETGVILLGITSHLVTVLLVYATSRWIVRAHWLAAATASMLFAFGPGLDYVILFFGTPFFVLTVTVAWSLALAIAVRKDTAQPMTLAFAVAGLVMGLTRPEGVFLAGLMVLGLLVYKPSSARPVLLAYVAVFGSLGVGYLVWRRFYFGHFLPNPFTKKGGGYLHLDGVKASVQNSWTMGGIVWLMFLSGLRSQEALRKSLLCLVPIVGFTLVWILMSNEMNHLMRFQYPVLPLLHLSWPFITRGLLGESHLLQPLASSKYPRAAGAAILGAAMVSLLAGQRAYYERRTEVRSYRDINFEVATLLSGYGAGRYTMATTEAGILPLYSRWRALDCWGLNEPWIAEHGGVTPEYLAGIKPELIVFHALTSDQQPLRFNREPMFGLGLAWGEMVAAMHEYAVAHEYVLAASFPDPGWGGTYYFYLRPDVRESAEIIEQLRTIRRGRFG